MSLYEVEPLKGAEVVHVCSWGRGEFSVYEAEPRKGAEVGTYVPGGGRNLVCMKQNP